MALIKFKQVLFEGVREELSFSSFDDVIEFINKNCNDWLNDVYGYSNLSFTKLQEIVKKREVLWRGIYDISDYIIETAFEKRKPRDVSFLIQNSINEALSKLGFSINRANSLYFRNRTRNRNFDTTENILY